MPYPKSIVSIQLTKLALMKVSEKAGHRGLRPVPCSLEIHCKSYKEKIYQEKKNVVKKC